MYFKEITHIKYKMFNEELEIILFCITMICFMIYAVTSSKKYKNNQKEEDKKNENIKENTKQVSYAEFYDVI